MFVTRPRQKSLTDLGDVLFEGLLKRAYSDWGKAGEESKSGAIILIANADNAVWRPDDDVVVGCFSCPVLRTRVHSGQEILYSLISVSDTRPVRVQREPT